MGIGVRGGLPLGVPSPLPRSRTQESKKENREVGSSKGVVPVPRHDLCLFPDLDDRRLGWVVPGWHESPVKGRETEMVFQCPVRTDFSGLRVSVRTRVLSRSSLFEKNCRDGKITVQ